VNTSASFAVTASGNGLSYQWRLDGLDLAGETNHTLTISAAQPLDEGDYTVVVSNADGAVISDPARLWVVPPSTDFIKDDFTNEAGRLPYFYILPEQYDPTRSYPLVCLFHGATPDEAIFPGYAATYPWLLVFASYHQQATDPAVVVYPTRRAGDHSWTDEYVRQVSGLLDKLVADPKRKIDTNRVYVGGGSEGVHAAWDLIGMRPGLVAGAFLAVGGQGSTNAASIKDVPLWAWCAADDEAGQLGNTQSLIRALRQAGGNPIYTQYSTGGHYGAAGMGLSTPAIVDWLLAQRLAMPSTAEPLLSITSPTREGSLTTAAPSLNLSGSAEALGQSVTRVTWENTANNKQGPTKGTNTWTAAGIPLLADKTNVVIVTATTTSWAPGFGGNTTFNDTLTVVCSPMRATLTWQGPDAVLNWTGGGPPYRVQRAADLVTGDWTDILIDAVPPVTLQLEGKAGFYRVVAH
jgi:predicted esterase